MVALSDEVVVPTMILPPRPTAWLGTIPEQLALPTVSEMAVQPGSLPSLAKALEVVPEHRKPRGFKADQPPVPLIPTLLLLLAAVMCGRRGYGSVAEWGAQCSKQHPEVLDALGFARARRPRTPVAATFFRLLRDMHLGKFQEALQDWLERVARAVHVTLPEWEQAAIPADQIGIDGKTVRGASARRERSGKSGQGLLHLVAAYAPALQAVLDQVASEGKGHELAAVELLLGRVELKGRVITADALATQREVCQLIKAGEGDYLLPVKENQPTLLADIREAFSPSATSGPEGADPVARAQQAR
jgi:predicted transposase YbfD/YdcC